MERVKLLPYVICPQCKFEWSKLTDDGCCFDCRTAKNDEIDRMAKVKRRLIKLLGSEEAIKWYTFDNFDPMPGTSEAFERMFNFNPNMENLYLYGPCGRGKTHLAYALAVKHLKAGRSVIVCTPRELVNRFRMRRSVEDEIEEMETFRSADVLVIDELGGGKGTEFSLEILSDILNKRSLNVKNGLIVTSNLSPDELSRKNNDDRLTSRIAGLCDFIEINTSRDYRTYRKQ